MPEHQSHRRGRVAAAALGLLLAAVALGLGLVRTGNDQGKSPATSTPVVGDTVLATVNGEAIYQSDIQAEEDTMTGALGFGFDEDLGPLLSAADARSQALAMAITHTVMVQVAEAQGITIAELELESAVQSDHEATQADEHLRWHAQEMMQLYGWSAEELKSRRREGLRELMLIDRLRERYRAEARKPSADEIEEAVVLYPEDGIVDVIAIGFDDMERASRAHNELAPLNAAQDSATFYRTFVDYGIAEGAIEPHAGYGIDHHNFSGQVYDGLEEYVASAQRLEQGDIGIVETAEGAALFLVQIKVWTQQDEVYAYAADALTSRLQREYVGERERQHLDDAEIVILEEAASNQGPGQ